MSKRRGKQLFGLADFGVNPGEDGFELAYKLKGGAALVNGKEIRLVSYADTNMGIVRTLDVMGDGNTRFGRGYTSADFPGREVECLQDDVLVEVLRGQVELFAAPDLEAPLA